MNEISKKLIKLAKEIEAENKLTINELCDLVKEKKITVDGAVDIIEKNKPYYEYAMNYFNPSKAESRAFWDMHKEWKRRQKFRVKIKHTDETVRKTGQLWEPCEKCGRKPSYMPLHLCDKCWPKI